MPIDTYNLKSILMGQVQIKDVIHLTCQLSSVNFTFRYSVGEIIHWISVTLQAKINIPYV